MVRLISRQRGGLAALKLTKLFGIDDFPAAKDAGKVLIIIIYCYLIIIIYFMEDLELTTARELGGPRICNHGQESLYKFALLAFLRTRQTRMQPFLPPNLAPTPNTMLKTTT